MSYRGHIAHLVQQSGQRQLSLSERRQLNNFMRINRIDRQRFWRTRRYTQNVGSRSRPQYHSYPLRRPRRRVRR